MHYAVLFASPLLCVIHTRLRAHLIKSISEIKTNKFVSKYRGTIHDAFHTPIGGLAAR